MDLVKLFKALDYSLKFLYSESMETFVKGLLFLAMAVAGLVILWLLGLLIHWLFMLIFFSFHYGEIHVLPGKVVDMDYTASYTTYTTSTVNGITSTTSHYHPEKNEVMIEVAGTTHHIDSDKLYQRSRIGDKVKFTFQNCYHLPRFWAGELKMDSTRILRVDCPNDNSVLFDDPKPVDHNVVRIEENNELRK